MADPKAPHNRLFFALMPEDATRAACAEAARDLKTRMQPDGYLLKPERYHITLPYLGDHVSSEQEAAAKQVAQLVSFPPFTLTLDQASSFKNNELPRYLAPLEPPPELTLMHASL